MVSRAYATQARWQEALDWFEQGRKLPMPQTTHAFNPEQVIFFPLVVAAKSAIELGRLDYAATLIGELRRHRSDHPDTHALQAELGDALRMRGGNA
jgi:hypothetical protein